LCPPPARAANYSLWTAVRPDSFQFLCDPKKSLSLKIDETIEAVLRFLLRYFLTLGRHTRHPRQPMPPHLRLHLGRGLDPRERHQAVEGRDLAHDAHHGRPDEAAGWKGTLLNLYLHASAIYRAGRYDGGFATLLDADALCG
jgi:hypothetical protein